MEQPNSDETQEGVSPGIKIFVIVTTVLTVIAFAIFLGMVAWKLLASPASKGWHPQLLSLGEKLKNSGLPVEAIKQYEIFLDNEKVDFKTRAEVSLKLGNLYTKSGNCKKALVWLFQVELADPDFFQANNVRSKIETCRQQLNLKKTEP